MNIFFKCPRTFLTPNEHFWNTHRIILNSSYMWTIFEIPDEQILGTRWIFSKFMTNILKIHKEHFLNAYWTFFNAYWTSLVHIATIGIWYFGSFPSEDACMREIGCACLWECAGDREITMVGMHGVVDRSMHMSEAQFKKPNQWSNRRGGRFRFLPAKLPVHQPVRCLVLYTINNTFCVLVS